MLAGADYFQSYFKLDLNVSPVITEIYKNTGKIELNIRIHILIYTIQK